MFEKVRFVRSDFAALAVFAVAGIGTLAPAAQADQRREAWGIYVCKDETGKTYTGDRPAAECARTAIREVRPDGLTRREIAAPMSPEQRAQWEEDQARLKDEQEQRKRQELRDRQLLIQYSNEKRLDEIRARTIADLNKEIDATYARILLLYEDLKEVKAEAEFYKGKAMPLPLKRRLQDVAGKILVEDQVVEGKREDIRAAEKHYDELRNRLRELRRQMEPANPQHAQDAGATSNKPVSTQQAKAPPLR